MTYHFVSTTLTEQQTKSDNKQEREKNIHIVGVV